MIALTSYSFLYEKRLANEPCPVSLQGYLALSGPAEAVWTPNGRSRCCSKVAALSRGPQPLSPRTSLHHQLQDPLSLSLFIGKVRCWIRSSLKILLVLNSYYVSTFSGFSILTCMPVINTAIQCDGQTIVQGTNLACGLFSYCLWANNHFCIYIYHVLIFIIL